MTLVELSSSGYCICNSSFSPFSMSFLHLFNSSHSRFPSFLKHTFFAFLWMESIRWIFRSFLIFQIFFLKKRELINFQKTLTFSVNFKHLLLIFRAADFRIRLNPSLPSLPSAFLISHFLNCFILLTIHFILLFLRILPVSRPFSALFPPFLSVFNPFRSIYSVLQEPDFSVI